MTKNDLYELLNRNGVPYEVTEHAPVFTIEEMLAADLPHPEIIAKNLFVRDDKKRAWFLITVKEDRRVNLREFQERFSTRKLSFASENDLSEILGLSRGSVTPFGLLNDAERTVRFFIDKDLAAGKLGIHPLENTATVWIRGADLVALIREHGNEISEF